MKLIVIAFAAALVWFLQAIFWNRNWQKGLSASVSFSEHAVTEGEHVSLKETITNNKFLPLPVLHVKFQMGRELVFTESGNSRITDLNYRSDIFSCMPWQEIRRTLDIHCTKRGYYTIPSVDLVSYDLFQSSRFVTSIPSGAALYVYPGPAAPLRLELPLRNLLGQIMAKQALLRDPFEMQSIRPYQRYDSFRDINWKATARTGKMKVNVHAPTSSWQVSFLLDTEADSIWKDYSLMEEAIRLCASMSAALLKQGIPVALFTNGRDCLSRTPELLNTGAGKEHLRAIMELLSRIIVDDHGSLSQPVPGRISGDITDTYPLEEYMESLISRPGSRCEADTTIYVLISTRQQKRLVQSYSQLCRRSPGSQWILPHRPGDALQLNDFPRSIQLFQWEVPYDRS